MTATIALHGTILEGTKLYVSKFVKKSEKIVGAVKEKFTNLYMKIFVDNMTGDLLEEIFYKYEKSYSIVGMKDSNGMSKGFGFGCLSSPEKTMTAILKLNGLLDSKTFWFKLEQRNWCNGKLSGRLNLEASHYSSTELSNSLNP